MTSLELVDCIPYDCRLPVASCIRRHELANGTPRGQGRKANEIHKAKLRFRHCIDCEAGAARRAGEQVGEVHVTEARSPSPPPMEPPAPAPEPSPPATSGPTKERDVKMKTCAVIDCANEFEVGYGLGNRKYCDAHQDPKDRKGLEVEGKAKKAAADALNSALGDSSSPAPKRTKRKKRAATPAPAAESVVGPRELLELAGFKVDEVVTPAGAMLFVHGAAS